VGVRVKVKVKVKGRGRPDTGKRGTEKPGRREIVKLGNRKEGGGSIS
jgi:hypothetical protein